MANTDTTGAAIHAYLRIAASRGRETARIGPFLATFSPGNDNPYLNYALPDDGAEPRTEDVRALIDAYEQRGRKPRLEFVATLAPAMEPALLREGFVVEGRLPLMTCIPGMEQIVALPEGIDLILPSTDKEILDLVAAQNEAYGELSPGPDAVAWLRSSLEAGAIAISARLTATGESVGGGVCTPPTDGLTEVAGIGVRTPFRQRGVARAVTGRLLHEAFASGAVQVAFLMAATEAEERIYARAGFRRIGESLHMSRKNTG